MSDEFAVILDLQRTVDQLRAELADARAERERLRAEPCSLCAYYEQSLRRKRDD